jgi:16S rRNA (guanine966-N2)-methyltransferase
MSRGLRVTGGELGGRRLKVPLRNTRPTSDRVRESLFARLPDLEGAAVLDVFAGSGSLGIEALSRGAATAVFVEQAARSAAVLRDNVRSLGLEDRASVRVGEAVAAVARLGREGRRFDLVLLDPPYSEGHAERALRALVEAGILAEGALVVVERARRHPVPDVAGLLLVDERQYGDTVISRYQPGVPGGSAGREAEPEIEPERRPEDRRTPAE